MSVNVPNSTQVISSPGKLAIRGKKQKRSKKGAIQRKFVGRKQRVYKSRSSPVRTNRRQGSSSTNSFSASGMDVAVREIEGAIGSRKRNVASLMAAIALPKVAAPIRWTIGTSSAYTSISTPFAVIEAPLQYPITTFAPMVVAGQSIAFAFRSILRSLVYYDPNESATTATYVGQFYIEGTGLAPESSQVEGNADLPLVCWVNDGATTYYPHGVTLYSGSSGDSKRWVWMNAWDQLNVSGSVSESGAGSLYFYQLIGKSPHLISSSDLSVGTINASFGAVLSGDEKGPIAPGYYCLSAENFSLVQITAVKLLISADCFCQLPAQDFDFNCGSIQDSRVVGTSLMFTNTTTLLSLGGSVAGYQGHKGKNWYDYTGNVFSAVSSSIGATTMDVKNGMYGFLLPAGLQDLEMIQEFSYSIADECVQDSFLDVTPNFDYIMIAPQVPVTTGISGLWTISQQIEYMTDDVWRAVSKPYVTSKDVEDAMQALSTFRQFHTNSFHFSDIWNGIKSFASSVLGGVQKYGPAILKGATALAPLLV